MNQKDFDLNIAKLKKTINTSMQKESDKQNSGLGEEQIEYLNKQISDFTLEKRIFCDGLFSMLLPKDLFGNPNMERDVWFFRSQAEKMVLVIKVIEANQSINFEKIQADYIDQMRQSKQQTKIDISDLRKTEFGTIYYFLAVHAMPGTELYDFIIMFQLDDKTIFMDFNFPQEGYFFWKIVFCKLVSTIREGEAGE